MGQLFSVLGMLYVHDCRIVDVIDDVSLFPPDPEFCLLIVGFSYLDHVECLDNSYIGTYGYDTIASRIPDSIKIVFVKVTETIDICLMHYKSKSSKRVVIYSHGNATDIGCCIGSMQILGNDLDTDYIYYDYEGYGCSEGVAKCSNFLRDIESVYTYAHQFFDGKNIFLTGESIGSVPSVSLASSLFKQHRMNIKNGYSTESPLGGVILHAALFSGSTSFPAGCLIKGRDPYCNASLISGIDCPIFHIHGTDDEIIPFKYGKKLYNVSKSPYAPWWVFEGHHGDIIVKHEEEYKNRILDFFEFCDHYNVNTKSEESR